MLKYVDTQVTFAEVPDEITLCINISNCPCHCPGCHSSYLAQDIGEWLAYKDNDGVCINIQPLLKSYYGGVTCICFMGGDSEPEIINSLGAFLRKDNPGIKIAWYSGRQELSKDIDLENFDYIKLGPYIKNKGPLNDKSTNQRFYKVNNKELIDITNKFWKNVV